MKGVTLATGRGARANRPLWVFASVALVMTIGACEEGRTDRDEPSEGVVSIDFNEYRGSMVSLPPGVSVSGVDGDDVPAGGDYYPFTGVNSLSREDEFDGFGAFTAGDSDHSFGIREHGSADLRDARLFLEYENRTNRTIHGLRVTYDVETWFVGERDNQIRLKYHSRKTGFGSIEPIVSTGNPRTTPVGDDRQGTPVDGSLPENRTAVELAFHFSELIGMAEEGMDRFTPLEPGDTGYLRWQYSNHRLTDGAHRSALALNNIRVEPIFTAAREDRTRAVEPLGTITFNRTAGFYDEPFDLELSTSLPAARIYYTMDGSEPDPSRVMSDREWEELPRTTRRRTFEYEDRISLERILRRENDISLIPTAARDDNLQWEAPRGQVPKVAVIRAVAIGELSRSSIRSATYLVPSSGAAHRSLPIWSIQTDRGHFFDTDTGIYVPGNDLPRVNYFRRGTEWEPPVYVELFEDDRRRVLAQNMGIRIHGNYTRTYPQKSLRLYSRTDYGPGRMRHRFFTSKDIDDYNRLLLRNAGNDWVGSMLADPTLQTLVQHLPIDTQHYRPSVVYLNGEYWGLHNIRDRYDEHYLETHYDVPRDDVVVLESEGVVDTGPLDEEGDLYEPYIEFRDRVSSGELAGWDALDEEMALSEYIDYVFAEVYAGNYDWPQNNIRYWRYVGPNPTEDGPRDGRWRWMLYDVDFAFGYGLSTTFDMVEWAFGYTTDHPFLEEWRRDQYQDRFEINSSLMESQDVRHELLQRFAVHLSTTASERRALELVDRHAARIESEMPMQIARWGRAESMEVWREAVARMRDFARRRPEIVRAHLVRFFDDASGVAELTVEGLTASSGVSLHTVDLEDGTEGVEIRDGRWSGTLLTGVPIVLESSGADLREADFATEDPVQVVDRSRRRLSFSITEDATITLPEGED